MPTILDYLKNTAQRVPDKIALADTETACSYSVLQERARVAGSRIASFAAPRTPIAFLCEKSVDTVTGFYGAVYAGCFYALLEPSLPPVRLAHILETLQPSVLITTSAHLAAAQSFGFSGTILLLEDLFSGAEDSTLLALRTAGMADTDPLYCNFTSGSTGVPKGVVLCHRSVMDFIDQFVTLFGFSEKDVLANQAPLDFDVSVKDLYTALKTGARVELLPRSFFSFPTKLMDHLAAREVTTLTWAVSALCIVSTMNGLEYNRPTHIQRILFSGEVMPQKHLAHWQQFYPDAQFVNLYGPTEITCNCTYHILTAEDFSAPLLPIGKPFPNERVFLLDAENQLIPQTTTDTKGELCVAGTALALGYYNDPIRTQEAFPQNPLHNHFAERIYRTGDNAYYGKDGNLYFAGRKDFQIKHMGHRIELSEIDTAATAVEGIARACCLYLEAEQKLLLCYEGVLARRPLLRELRDKLPQFMLPTAFLQLEHLPVTKNGKLDRRALETAYENEQRALAAEKAEKRAQKERETATV